MTHEEAIEIIEKLYPPDSASTEIAATGQRFLETARAMEWRNESDAVLIEYAKLCEEKERIGREHYRECLRSES